MEIIRKGVGALFLSLALWPHAAAAAGLEDALKAVRARPGDLRLRADLAADPYRLAFVQSALGDVSASPGASTALAQKVLRSTAPADSLRELAGVLEAGAAAPPELGAPAVPGLPPLRGLLELAAALRFAQSEIDAVFADLSDARRKELLAWLKTQLAGESPAPNRLKAGEIWWEKDEALLAAADAARKGRILAAGIRLLEVLQRVLPELRIEARFGAKKAIQTPGGLVVLGSSWPDVFEEDAVLIVDPGGDDVYRGAAARSKPGRARLIVDLGGNDRYLASGFGGLGGGLLGLDILVDAAGDDVYAAEDAALGAGALGLGVLWDLAGDDVYRGGSFSEGAGAFGAGLLIDRSGMDVYRASYLSQGAGFVRGAGLLADASGNDVYSVGGGQPDGRGYSENYGKFKQGEVFQSLSQGVGLGMRDMAAGGIGLLLDGAGNDGYQLDYFGQGAAYWLSYGLLYDASGNDSYQARRYAQGAGVHFAAGSLIDAGGNDRYASWGVSQGCGHDYALGVLLDAEGDDAYASDWTSMGASNAMGVGVLLDQEGSDRYTIPDAAMSYWDAKRYGAGIGLLLDSGGASNRFSVARSTRAWSSTRWGSVLAQEERLAWTPPEPALPPFGGTSAYEKAAEKDREFLKARLTHARTLGDKTFVAELLAISGGWGIDGAYPDAAKRELLSKDPASALPLLLQMTNPKGVYARLSLEEYLIGAPQAVAPLETMLAEHAEPAKRARAAYFLGQMRSASSSPALIRALSDASWRVRAGAARALGVLKSAKFRRELEELAKLFEKGGLDQEKAAAWFRAREKSETMFVLGLAGIGRSDWPALAEGLTQENTAEPVARKAAELAAARAVALRDELADHIIWMKAPSAGAELAALLKDEEPEARRWAAYALGESRQGAKALTGALSDPDYGVREAAAESLGRIGAAALPPLKRVLSSDSAELRALAYRALGAMDDKSARKLILSGLGDRDGFARLSALQALDEGRRKGLWTVERKLWTRMTQDENLWVRGLAEAEVEAEAHGR